MSDALVFPNSRSGLFDLVNETEHAGQVVSAFYHLPADEYGALQGPFPIAHIYGSGGTQGYVDRVERRTIEVYAPGELAVEVLESIIAFISGSDIDTPSGYFDRIECDTTPEDIPYQSDTLNRAMASVLVTSRPIN